MQSNSKHPHQKHSYGSYYLKTFVVSIATLGMYAIARITRFPNGWRFQSDTTLMAHSESISSPSLQFLGTGLSDVNKPTDFNVLSEEIVVPYSAGIADFQEVVLELPQETSSLSSVEASKYPISKRRLFAQTDAVNAIPDQVIDVSQIYNYQFNPKQLFGYPMQVILDAEGGLPSWLSTKYSFTTGSYITPERAQDVAIEGGIAYVAAGSAGLQIFNVTNTNQPLFLGSYSELEFANRVIVKNAIAYLSDTISLFILNVSNPAHPNLLSNYSELSSVTDVVLNQDIAYVVDSSLLHILDVTDPAHLISLGSRYIPALGNVAAMSGNIVSVSTSNGLFNYNVSAVSPDSSYNYNASSLSSSTKLLSSATTSGQVQTIELVGKMAYVGESSGLQIFNIADPIHPVLLGSYTTPDSIARIIVNDEIAYVAVKGSWSGYGVGGWNGMQILNVTNPSEVTLIGSYNGGSGVVEGLVIKKNLAYLAQWVGVAPTNGLFILDVSDPAAIKLLGTYLPLGGGQLNVLVSGTKAYVSILGTTNIEVVDVSNSMNPVRIGSYSTGAVSYESTLKLMGNILYYSAHNFYVFDVSNSSNIRLLATLLSVSNIADFDISTSGGTCYQVTQNPNNLNIYSIVNASQPVLIGSYGLSGTPNDISIEGSTAYIGMEESFEILSIADPQNLAIGTYTTTVPTIDICVVGNTVYLLTSDNHLLILNNTDPTQPILVNTYTPSGNAKTVDAVGTIIYLGSGNDLEVLDATDPMNINLLENIPGNTDQVLGMTIQNGILYTAAGSGGLQLYQLSTVQLLGIPSLFDVGTQYNLISKEIINQTQFSQTMFSITVAQFPTLFQPVSSSNIFWANKAFTFGISKNTFQDPNNDPLSYTASSTNPSPLPNWLVFYPNNLTFSGTAPDVSNPSTWSVQLTATNPLGGYVSTIFSFTIQPNVPPTVTNQLSTQLASVGVNFKFVIPENTFVDAEGDALTYSAQLSDGTSLPAWLKFDQITFSGTPGQGDTGFYSTRILPILLTASDGKFSASTTFNIDVGGTSSGELFIKIVTPMISVASAAYAVYHKRALCLNRYKPERYQRLGNSVTAGEPYTRDLSTPVTEVARVQAKLDKPVSPACMRFFKSPRIHIPGGSLLPHWLYYDSNTNALCSDKIPENAAKQNLIIQVKDHAGVIREQFILKIEPSHQLGQVDEPEQRVSEAPKFTDIALGIMR